MLPFIINCKVYPFDVMVYFGEDREPLYRNLKKYLSESDIKELREYKYGFAKSVMFPNGQTLLYMKRKPETHFELGTLAHEIFHCTCFIMDRVGIKLTDESDEAYAYLIGYLTNEILKKIDKIK